MTDNEANARSSVEFDEVTIVINPRPARRDIGGFTEMTDREVLELAAKAAGIKWLPATTEKGIELEPKFGLWLVIDGEPNEYQRRRWNPLTDDGDALRLAVTLRLTVNLTECQCCASIYACQLDGEGEYPDISVRHSPEFDDAETTDIYAATRRAIVRAAAEIGKAMK